MRIFAIIILTSILIAFDMSSKQFIEMLWFWVSRDALSIIWEYLTVELSYNTGIAFSLPIRGIALQILTVWLICAIIYQYASEEYRKKSKLLDISYAFILAWALSHGYERIFVGHVVDFISVKYFAILNFADIFISLGAVGIIIYYLFYNSHESR